jgi:CubicO group peptidase (beta-lactamase class C family)
MQSTSIALNPAQKARIAHGHTAARQPAANWDLTAFAGAGGIRSDAADMLAFVAAHLGYTETPLAKAMDSMTRVRRPGGRPDTEIGLAWIIRKRGDREIRWHNGGTGGYRSFIGYDPKSRVGVVVLSNMSTNVGVDDIGMHLLDPSAPLAKLPALKQHKEIAVDSKVLASYPGAYQLAPGVAFTITLEGNRLFAQLTGQEKFEVFAESPRDFFYKAVDAQLTFEDGALVLHQNGRDQRAKRQ